MLFALIGMGVSAWLGAGASPLDRLASLLPPITFQSRPRSVSNWRLEAALSLDGRGGVALPLLLGREPGAVTRCVRLNNYWCIKRAGWAGEIASDPEGHVAFASALEGADVAALLLRRYYVFYGRHSAMAIVSHWAPAVCDAPAVAPRAIGPRMRRVMADRLTLHGIGHTLRARFLAARGRRPGARALARGRPSVVPDRLIGVRMGTPAIALGLGGDAAEAAPRSLSVLAEPPLRDLAAPSMPFGSACVADASRLRSYATKVAAGVAPTIDADLMLFDAAGQPTAHLAEVMNHMAEVEIGPLGAGRALIAVAVAHVGRLTAPSARALVDR